MKKLLITLLKIVISAAIIGWLVYDSVRGQKNANVFANLRDQPKQWDMLAIAWACCTGAVLLTFVRWWYLVRALDIDCPFFAAIRISFWGYLFNLAPLGIVGGDLVKAVMLGHEHPQDRAKSLASVLVDRVIGTLHFVHRGHGDDFAHGLLANSRNRYSIRMQADVHCPPLSVPWDWPWSWVPT